MGQMTKTIILLELAIVFIGTFLLGFLFPQLKSALYLLPAVYLLVERRVRRRPWSDIGFRPKKTLRDLRVTWHWVLLGGVISPLATIFAARLFLPGFIDHVLARLPMDVNQLISAIVVILFATFMEEVLFRGFLQERLGWFTGPVLAIGITSLLFAFGHFAVGNPSIVAFDISTIFIDGVIFGIIYHRTRNIFPAWVSHCLSNIIALACIVFFL